MRRRGAHTRTDPVCATCQPTAAASGANGAPAVKQRPFRLSMSDGRAERCPIRSSMRRVERAASRMRPRVAFGAWVLGTKRVRDVMLIRLGFRTQALGEA